jgi:uncharacterized protein (DUF2267 family)
MTISAPVAHGIQTMQEWLKELKESGELADQAAAYKVLRAVLHQLRDRLTVEEAADFGAQLPLMVRGLYFEHWRPHKVPRKIRSKAAFLDELSTEILPHTYPVDWAVSTVFGLLARHCDPGEIDDVKGQLPDEIKELWPVATAATPRTAASKVSSDLQSKQLPKAPGHHHTPHDDPLPGTVGTGEDICPECHGSGKAVDRQTGKTTEDWCERCEGTGLIIEGIG